MQSFGWLMFCLGFAPTFAYLRGFQAVPVIGYPTNYAFVVFLGAVGYVLSTQPTSSRSVRTTICFLVIFFGALALTGALLFLMVWSSLNRGYVFPAFAPVVFMVLGVAEVLLMMRTIKIPDAPAKLDWVWKWLRVSFAVLAVVFFIQLIQAYAWDSHMSAHRVYFGWLSMALVNVFCGIVTTPTNRARFCVWLSSLGRNEKDKQSAEEASRLIWVEFDALDPNGSPSEPEQRQVGVPHDQ
jgi:hypothetical protein